jgi:hypothetical protein
LKIFTKTKESDNNYQDNGSGPKIETEAGYLVSVDFLLTSEDALRLSRIHHLPLNYIPSVVSDTHNADLKNGSEVI